MSQSPEDLIELRRLFDHGADLGPVARAAWLASLAPATRARLERLLAGIDCPTSDTAPLSQAESARPGERIGSWSVVRLVGHGGMGAVYEATRDDDQYRKRVAIKLVQRGLDSALAQARFRREAQSAAGLNHPNIVSVYDTGEEMAADGSHVQPYIVME
ncbi:MAG TPA: protein kinase, partial [Gemmatimonadales bacterium]|nr:protein kinase [Gemmatimonadales bacterium]